jgi:hypothetical protein
MYNSNGIQINKVGNGFIVVLPTQSPNFFGMSEDSLVQAARIMKGEVEKDPVMEAIYQNHNQEQQPVSNIVALPVETNIFVFLTFPEVLEFLKSKIN